MIMKGESFEAIVDYMNKTAEEQRLDPFHLGTKDDGNAN